MSSHHRLNSKLFSFNFVSFKKYQVSNLNGSFVSDQIFFWNLISSYEQELELSIPLAGVLSNQPFG